MLLAQPNLRTYNRRSQSSCHCTYLSIQFKENNGLNQNFESFTAKVPEGWVPYFTSLLQGTSKKVYRKGCDFFTDKSQEYPGIKQMLLEEKDKYEQIKRLREKERNNLYNYLKDFSITHTPKNATN